MFSSLQVIAEHNPNQQRYPTHNFKNGSGPEGGADHCVVELGSGRFELSACVTDCGGPEGSFGNIKLFIRRCS